MTDQTARPEVDDPRVLALAKARQQIAYESPFNFVCPPWDGLTEQEQHLSLLDARDYLRAALKAGLVAEPAAVPAPATDQAALVDIAAQAIRDSNGSPEALKWWRAHPQLIPAHVYAAAVLAVLPAPVDRAAVRAEAFREAAVAVRRGAFADTFDRMADELAPADAGHGDGDHSCAESGCSGEPTAAPPAELTGERLHADEQVAEERLRCPRCREDITDYAEDDHVFRTGDERPYCSGECVIAAHRTGLPTVDAQQPREPRP